jgi:hypothetical protein
MTTSLHGQGISLDCIEFSNMLLAGYSSRDDQFGVPGHQPELVSTDV